jgi:hypothetical protein
MEAHMGQRSVGFGKNRAVDEDRGIVLRVPMQSDQSRGTDQDASQDSE